MEKKTYIAPNMTTMELHIESHILDGSATKTFSMSETNRTTHGSGMDSREKSGGFGSGLWEDMK